MIYLRVGETIIYLFKNKKVLYLGCVGFADLTTENRIKLTKLFLHYLLTENADTTGIEYSKHSIQYYIDKGIFNNVVYEDVEKLEDIDFDGVYDVIVASDILEHLSNQGLMPDGLKRCCNGNSVIIVTTPHSIGWLSFFRYIVGRLIEGKVHVMAFYIHNVNNLLRRHGFSALSVDTCYQKHATTKPLSRLSKIFFEVLPKNGGTPFVFAAYNRQMTY